MNWPSRPRPSLPYSTESKTFDSAFALLDAGISREDFLVAISRARGVTVAYGVAASELTDPEFGPGTREIADSAHELRAGAERAAGEYAAREVAARKRIEAKAPADLARRRAELERRAGSEPVPSPSAERLEVLQRRIEDANARLGQLGGGRDAEAKKRLAQPQLRRLEAERDDLALSTVTNTRSTGLTPLERSELALIEDRLTQLRRRQIAVERVRPTKLIAESLGARPTEPLNATLWNEGVELIYAYRQRYGIIRQGGHPLGPRPRDAVQRRQRREAELRLARVQQRLGKEQARSAERGMALTP